MAKSVYDKQIEEVEKIVAEIESGELSVDAISVKVKKALELLRKCQSHLTKIEDEVNAIFTENGTNID